jgi:hypothetical protein
MFGVLDHFWPPVVLCYATEDAVQIGNCFITIRTTRNYNHSQLFITLCHIYTAYSHTLVTTITYYTLTLADFSATNYCLKLSHTLHLHTSRVWLLSGPHS